MRSVLWRNLVPLTAILLAVACSGDSDTATGGAAAAGGVQTGFCDAVTQIGNAEPAGFAALRAKPIGMSAWSGRIVPAGFTSCSVEGTARFRAEYVCWGKNTEGSAHSLVPSFEQAAKSMDACLGRNSGLHRYQHSQTFDFAGGERVVLWRDVSGGPGPGFSLKIEENLAKEGEYSVRLGAMTLR